MESTFDLSRFVQAQKQSYPAALAEIRAGRKRSHWMWYIFPQLRGLGMSSTSLYYGVRGLEEARAILKDPCLGHNIREISAALLDLDTDNASDVFGWPDDLKLRSSMTLFALVSEENSVFHRVLEKYFDGRMDPLTLERVGIHE